MRNLIPHKHLFKQILFYLQADATNDMVVSPLLTCLMIYSYLMGVDAIDQTMCPSVLGMTKCTIAFGHHYLNNCFIS